MTAMKGREFSRIIEAK